MARLGVYLLAVLLLALPASAFATTENPVYDGSGDDPQPPFETDDVTAYTDHAAWLAAAGTTTLIDFEAFGDGQLITTELAPYGIAMVTGESAHGDPLQYVTASTSLPFPMFTVGTLPTEPNFLSNDLNAPVYATGSITFELVSPSYAIGAYVADASPLDNFAIEVFSGGSSVGMISVPPRTLPSSFVGIVSTVAFDEATFYSVSPNDSWGLDNVELGGDYTATGKGTWGSIKGLFR